MSITTRLGSGLAITPQKDLDLFADMARRGKHLSGVAALGHGWRFEDGPAEDVVFDLAYEDDPPADYFDIFRAAGWTPVLSLGEVHIFKASPGTTPVHAGTDSRRDELTRNRDRFLRYSAVTVALFVVVALGLSLVSWNDWVEVALLTLVVIPVVYTVFPLVGYGWRLRTLQRHAR